jgi:hypothetical protein
MACTGWSLWVGSGRVDLELEGFDPGPFVVTVGV